MSLYEFLKIQKGGLYIEIRLDNNQLENIELVKDFLTFMSNRIKNQKAACMEKVVIE